MADTKQQYAYLLTEEQITEFKKQFAQYDHDGNGRITMNELKAVMNSMGNNPSKAELKAMMKAVDVDGNGAIDQTEFMNMMALKLKEGPTEKEMRGAFRMFDKDGNGFITVSELRQVMKSLGGKVTVEEGEKMIKRFDIDGDGRINYEEFIKMMAT